MENITNQWTNVVSHSRNDLVFESRHKDYGAYQIRRNYNNSLLVALSITMFVFITFFTIPTIMGMMNHDNDSYKSTEINIPISLPIPPDPVVPEVKIPTPPTEAPLIETVKLTPPTVVDDPTESDPIVTQSIDKKIGTETVHGEDPEVTITDVTTNTIVEEKEETPLIIVQQMPTFPGGEEEMMRFIKNSIVYPVIEKEGGISGTCYLTFVVEKDGSISNVDVLGKVPFGPGYDKEAVRVIKSMPNWIPGKQNGREVRVQFNLPIRFIVR